MLGRCGVFETMKSTPTTKIGVGYDVGFLFIIFALGLALMGFVDLGVFNNFQYHLIYVFILISYTKKLFIKIFRYCINNKVGSCTGKMILHFQDSSLFKGVEKKKNNCYPISMPVLRTRASV